MAPRGNNLSLKIFGTMGAVAVMLMFFLAYMIGKSSLEASEVHYNRQVDILHLMQQRLQLCNSDKLKQEAKTEETINQGVRLASLIDLMKRENELMDQINSEILETAVTCEQMNKQEEDAATGENANAKLVINTLRFQNKQLEGEKDAIKQRKKKIASDKRRFVAALRLENRELQKQYQEKKAKEREEAQEREREAERSRLAEEAEQQLHAKRRKRRAAREEEDSDNEEPPPPPPPRKKCVDLSSECRDWASNGECQRNPVYMSKNCRKSCQFCKKKKKVQDDDE